MTRVWLPGGVSMRLKDYCAPLVRGNLGAVRADFAGSHRVWEGLSAQEQSRLFPLFPLFPRLTVRVGHGDSLGHAAGRVSVLQNGPAAAKSGVGAQCISSRLAAVGRTVSNVAGDQLGSGSPRRLQEVGQKRGEQTGPSPVDRAQCGTALHLACGGRACRWESS